jgi:hypothetical protein
MPMIPQAQEHGVEELEAVRLREEMLIGKLAALEALHGAGQAGGGQDKAAAAATDLTDAETSRVDTEVQTIAAELELVSTSVAEIQTEAAVTSGDDVSAKGTVGRQSETESVLAAKVSELEESLARYSQLSTDPTHDMI